MKTNIGLALLVAGSIATAFCGGQALDSFRSEHRDAKAIEICKNEYPTNRELYDTLDSLKNLYHENGFDWLKSGAVSLGASACGFGILYSNLRNKPKQ